MPEWTIGAVLDAIAEVIPDRPMTVCGQRTSTFADSADRTRRLANFLAGNGFGAHRERGDLRNWECGQDRVINISGLGAQGCPQSFNAAGFLFLCPHQLAPIVGG